MPDGRRCLADADRKTMLLSPAQDWEDVSPALRYPSARPTASGTGRGCYDANPACIILTHKKDTRIPGVFYSVPARYSHSHHKKDAPKGVLA